MVARDKLRDDPKVIEQSAPPEPAPYAVLKLVRGMQRNIHKYKKIASQCRVPGAIIAPFKDNAVFAVFPKVGGHVD
jgi:hypothetical protein